MRLRLTFHGLPPSPAVAQAVRKRAESLARFCDRIQTCNVVVEPWSHRHRTGNLYTARIDVTVPGAELAVGRDHTPGHAHEDVHVAIRYAFDEMRRLLQDRARRARGHVKGAARARP